MLLVHRPRWDDWTLPIGRLEPGEATAEAALREVAEETGCACRIAGFLDTLTVDADDGHHRFHIFEMEPVAGEFVANPETDAAEWFPVDEAITIATHANVRALLRDVAPRLGAE